LQGGFLERRFWGASEFTIWELIGSLNTSAFLVTYASGTVVGTDTDTSPGSSFSRLKRVPPQ